MVPLLFLFLDLLISPLKPTGRLEAENAALRHQLAVLQRKLRGRIEFTNGDRLFFILLYRLFPSVLKAMMIVQPETVVRWHRAGFCHYWRWKSRRRGGRPPIQCGAARFDPADERGERALGRPAHSGRVAQAGLYGSAVDGRQIHGQARQSTRSELGTFLRNHAPQIAAMDLFVVPTISFIQLYVLVIVQLGRRELAWINVARHPTADWIGHQITEAFPWNEIPRYLVRDQDGIYGTAVRRRLRAMGIRDKPIAPGSPWQNGYAERLIGTIRRECVDHLIVFGARHLRRVLREYAVYYNSSRTFIVH